jgi:hypothetical protein
MISKNKTLKITGFDPAGEPEIRMQEDGSLHVVFNFMPPSYMENPTEMGVFYNFNQQMQDAIGVQVDWEDRELYVIREPQKDTAEKIVVFLQNFKPEIDPISGLWLGYYEYEPSLIKPRAAFSVVLKRSYQMVTGKSIEVQTFGHPTPHGLTAHFVGGIDGNKLYLVKTYDGSGGQEHSFAYHFTLDEAAQTLTGTWSQTKEWGGTVFMKRVDKASI